MKDFSAIREAAAQDGALLPRAVALAGGLLGGLGLGRLLASWLPAAWNLTDTAVGPVLLGYTPAHQFWSAGLIWAGAGIGAAIGLWGWLFLAHAQSRLAPLPLSAALKRAAFPFVLFFPQAADALTGRLDLTLPAAGFALLALGFTLIAWLERGDKRKIFFAFPTESEYHPSGLFTHGAIMVLGACAGWYLQTVEIARPLAWMGIWLPIGAGILLWLLAGLLAWLLGFLYTKHSFNQALHAVALAMLPLAVLPLNVLFTLRFVEGGKLAGGFQVSWVAWALPVLAGIAAFAVFVLTLLKLSPKPLETQPGWEEVFRALMLLLAVPVLLISLSYSPVAGPLGANALAGRVDLLHEGESLASAQALATGRLPYKEVLFRQGFGTDALAGLMAPVFGGGLAGLRLMTAWLLPAGLVAFYLLAIFCLPWAWALIATAGLLSGHLGWLGGAKYLVALVGVLFTLIYLQRGRWWTLVLAGLLTAGALILSFAGGALALGGQAALLVFHGLFGTGSLKARLIGAGMFLGALLAGLAPWWLYLGLTGSFSAYFQNFAWWFIYPGRIFSQSIPGWGDAPTWTQLIRFLVPPLAVLWGGLHVLAAIPKAKERGLPWNVVVLTSFTAVLWSRFVLRGGADYLMETLPLAALLLAFFLYKMTTHNPRVRGVIYLLLAMALLVPQNGRLPWLHLTSDLGAKTRVTVDGLVKAEVPGLGETYLPAAQSAEIRGVAEYLDNQVGSAETFFDFSNQPLYYALVPRRPAVETLTTAALSSFSQQTGAVQNLADAKVKAVLFGLDTPPLLQNIGPEVRQYAVAEYLWQNFTPVKLVGRTVIGVPRAEALSPEPAAIAAVQHPADLGDLPWAWGQQKKYEPAPGSGAALNLANGRQSVEPAGLTVTVQGAQASVGASAQPVTVRLNVQTDPLKPVNVWVLTLRADPSLNGRAARLTWGGTDTGSWVAFRLHGGAHRYVFRLGGLAAWALAPDIKNVNLVMPGGDFAWEGGSGLAVKDLPAAAAQVPVAVPGPAATPAAAASKTKNQKP